MDWKVWKREVKHKSGKLGTEQKKDALRQPIYLSEEKPYFGGVPHGEQWWNSQEETAPPLPVYRDADSLEEQRRD